MSTTDNTSATPGIQQTAPIIQLPQFSLEPTQINQEKRDSRAGSSTTTSRWSASDRQGASPTDSRVKSLIMENANGKKDQSTSQSQRRNHNRSSGGGFLLESTTHSSRLSQALLSRTQQDGKGKRKNEVSEISLPKRRARQSVIQTTSSRQSSPLSVEVKQDDSKQEHENQNTTDNAQEDQDQTVPQGGNSETPGSRRSAASSVIFEADTAQIVDMALKLSEGRRRMVSARRVMSGEVPGKRIMSIASSRQVRTPTKNLGQLVTTPNVVTTSPLPNTMNYNGTAADEDDPMVIDDPFFSQKFRDMEESVEISRATAARVEKAKTYLELAYEHRRLLSHLPPIQRPITQRKDDVSPSDSKLYNPLQYVRNRKLRLREKIAINSDTEGWHDIEKVRAWVDAVIHSHPETVHDVLECVRLPPLNPKDADDDEGQSPKAHASPGQQPARPRRPKSDWVTHPGDLLADAFWLEQGLNKTKIQDRDNNSIYPPDTAFKFSGWRNRVPVDVPERLQQPTPPLEDSPKTKRTAPLENTPELPTFRSTHKKDKDISRSGKHLKVTDSLKKIRSNSRGRKMPLLDSSSDSDSGSDSDASQKSGTGLFTRGRKQALPKFDLPDGDPFGPPISSVYPNNSIDATLTSSEPNLGSRDSKRPSIDNSRLVSYLKRNSIFRTSSHERGRSRGDGKKHKRSNRSEDQMTRKKQGETPTEDGNATPESPVNYGLPSITINLDVPVSRSPSPTKKSKPGILQSFKDKSDKSKQLDQERIETNDFADFHEKTHSRNQSIDTSQSRDSSNQNSRGTSPFTRGTSPFTRLRRESTAKDEPSPTDLEHRASTISRQSTKQSALSEQPSRIRGIFKGGRIAELVGNEVSRVGDFIWKREVPPAYRHHTSGSEASFGTNDQSDTDEDLQNGAAYKTSTRDKRLSTSTQSSGGHPRSAESARVNEKQQLHNPNLPSFTSPFQRDREKQDEKQVKQQDFLLPDSSDDHISRQAAQHRSGSKSPRLDRAALPKLDTSTTPRSVNVLERRNSYGFSDAFNRSQSATRSSNGLQVARLEINGSARSSVAGLSSHLYRSSDSKIEKHGSNAIDRYDVLRIRSLLLVSAVKAKNLNAVYDRVPAEPSKLLLETIRNSDKPLEKPSTLQVRKRDEHVLAARNLIAQLVRQSDQIHDQLQAFSNTKVPQLHEQIQILEDEIENSITPRVRTAADNAGELSVKLTTTSTQAVKSLDDAIGEAFRLRRRGPFRWLRLVWYTIIEWTVVGLLWFIWAIVTIIRVFIGLFKGTARTVRWLLWID